MCFLIFENNFQMRIIGKEDRMQGHLTFQESKEAFPIARISGGRYDGEVIFISDKPDAPEGKKRPQEDQVDLAPMLKGMKLKPRERAAIEGRIQKALRFGKEPEDDIIDLYKRVKARTDMGDAISLADGELMAIPDPNERTVTFVAGASGSGKSSWICNQVKQFRKLFPKADVYLFSRKEADPSLDDVKPMRIVIDDELGQENYKYTDFPAGSCVIFDDVDRLNKPQTIAVNDIMTDCLNVGRQHRLYVYVTSHQTTDYRKTRDTLNEAHMLVFFPHQSSTLGIKYMLDHYAGLDKKQIKRILKLPSRWVAVRTHAPRCVLYQTGIYLLGTEDSDSD
jgi:hypothetical protein